MDPQPASVAYAALEESLTIRPRAYQWEVFEAAREGNVRACNATDKDILREPSCTSARQEVNVSMYLARLNFKISAGHCIPGYR